jgi:hypothetical protein
LTPLLPAAWTGSGCVQRAAAAQIAMATPPSTAPMTNVKVAIREAQDLASYTSAKVAATLSFSPATAASGACRRSRRSEACDR